MLKKPLVTAAGAALAVALCSPAWAATAGSGFTPNLHLKNPTKGGTFNIQDVEPGLRVDACNRVFVSAIRGVPTGTDLFQVQVRNGVAAYAYRGQPDGLPMGIPPTGLAPGGGDTDEAIGSFAACKPTPPTYDTQVGTLLVTSLNLATIFTSQTADEGRTYMPGGNAAGAIPVVDREWNAAQGGLERYDVTHDLATGNIVFSKSMDGGLTWVNGTFTDTQIASTTTNNNELGEIAVDQKHHILYQVFASVANASENLNGTVNAVPFHVVWVAKSTDDGLTWSDNMVFNGPKTQSYAHIFPMLATDDAGNVYAGWSDNTNVFVAYSPAGPTAGIKWSAPIQVTGVNGDPYKTHIFPWLSAAGNGGLDVVYYETTGANPNLANDTWQVGFAQNKNVLASPLSFTHQIASDHIIHTGQICESGIGCDATQKGNRNLADDFQVAVDPLGFGNIAYTDDHDSTMPPQVYFTRQTSGGLFGGGSPIGPAAVVTNHGCIADNYDAGGRNAMRLKAPEFNTPGWLTVVLNRQIALAGPVTSFMGTGPTSGLFTGKTRNGALFAGSVTNGALTVHLGSKTLTVAPDKNSAVDGDNSCLMKG